MGFSKMMELLQIKNEGKNKNEITIERLKCYMCKHNTMPYKKEDKYMLALAKLYEKNKKQ